MSIINRFKVGLSKEGAVAPIGYSRWLMAAAALLIHFPLGQAYGFSVFNGPLAKLLENSLTGIDSLAFYGLQGIGLAIAAYFLSVDRFGKSKAIGIATLVGALLTAVIFKLTPNASPLTLVGGIFSTAIVFLGSAAAMFGKWVERSGPRKAMIVSATCFLSGLVVSGLGAAAGSLTLIMLGYGVLGGIGLGIGYISPVSTLIKWFPDRRGMATGLAIMGFGGGALVGSPLATNLMQHFKESSATAGISETFFVMAAFYAVFQIAAACIARIPYPGYKPEGYVEPEISVNATETEKQGGFTVADALRTKQFWMLWMVLMLNIAAGIGILGQASLMAQKMVGISAASAAGFVGLLSICNMGGRFIWSSFSDKIGRKAAYAMYSGVGALGYFLIPAAAEIKSMALFAGLFALVLSYYGAGFATIPAYLADMFGKREVGAIHGRLLTAWSTAAVVGSLVVNAGRDYLTKVQGFSDAAAYSTVVYAMVALLVAEFVINLFIKKPKN